MRRGGPIKIETRSGTAIAFNLAGDPWLPYLSVSGQPHEGSIRHVLTAAHEIRDLSVDSPTQYPVLIRFLLAVLHRALGMRNGIQHPAQPRSKGSWIDLYRRGSFPPEPIAAYLDHWATRLDLFDPAAPFGQTPGLNARGDARKPTNLLIPHAASGNNAPIFSAARDRRPVALTPAEAARWLLHLHAWDTAGIKTGAVGDPAAKQGKTTGNRTGHLGSLGVLIPTGTTLWETLMFNLRVLNDDICPDDDLPFWERPPSTPEWTTAHPAGVLTLYGWQSRRVRLFPEASQSGVVVREVLVCAGDRIADPTGLTRLEPHSAWYPVDGGSPGTRGKDDGAAGSGVDSGPGHRPIRHRPGQQLWRGLGGILGRRFDKESGIAKSPVPAALHHINSLRLPQERVLQIRAFGITYGIQSAVIDETYTDTLPLPVALLRPEGQGVLDSVAVDSVRDSDTAAWTLGRLAADIAYCSGGDDEAQKAQHRRAQDRLYAVLDQPFREWVAGLVDEERAEEYRVAWHRRVHKEASRIAGSLLADAPPTALRTRMRAPKPGAKDKRPIPVNLPLIHGEFYRSLARALPQAGGTDPTSGAEAADQQDDANGGAL